MRGVDAASGNGLVGLVRDWDWERGWEGVSESVHLGNMSVSLPRSGLPVVVVV